MSQPIYITKKGFYVKSGKLVKIDRPVAYYLRHIPKFEKGFTVLDWMELLKIYQEDIDRIFLAYTRGFKFEPFYEEAVADKNITQDLPIDFLEFSWAVDISNFSEFKVPRYEISEYIHLTGKKIGDKENYGLAFTNLSTLKNATFKLNTRIEYSKYNYGEIWEDKKITKEVFLKGNKAFNFGDIIGCFLYEISFFGHPTHRDEKLAALENQSEKRVEGNFVPFEKVQLDWKMRSLNQWKKKKDSKTKILKLEKLEKEIGYLKGKLNEIESKKDIN